MATINDMDELTFDDSAPKDEGPLSEQIDQNYDTIQKNLPQTSQGQPGITVTPTSGLTVDDSGKTDTFSVALNSAPTDTVTIDMAVSNPALGAVSTSSLVFDADNWSEPQTVTVNSVANGSEPPNSTFSVIVGPAISSDPNYSGMQAPAVSVTDAGATGTADIGVSVNAPSSIAAGKDLLYTVTVVNHGPSAATNALCSFSIEGQVSDVFGHSSVQASQGTFQNDLLNVDWHVGDLNSGASATMTIDVPTVNFPFPGDDLQGVVNVFPVDVEPPDPNPNNNIATADTTFS